jgi:hypothetical protein
MRLSILSPQNFGALFLVLAQRTSAVAFVGDPTVVTIGQPYVVNFVCEEVSRSGLPKEIIPLT